MKKYILFLFMITIQANGQVGFFDPRDASIPSALKEASESVFEVRTAFLSDLANFTDVKIVDISSESQKNKVIGFINSLPSPYDEKDKSVMKAFVQKCERENNKSECILPTSLNSGSGFITGDGSTFWTNAHVLEKMLQTKATTNETKISDLLNSTGNMPVFIFNKDGHLVFDGLKEVVKFKVTPTLTNLTSAQGSFYAIDSDYVSIDLHNKLGKPLKVSNRKSSSGDRISIVGLPSLHWLQSPRGNGSSRIR